MFEFEANVVKEILELKIKCCKLNKWIKSTINDVIKPKQEEKLDSKKKINNIIILSNYNTNYNTQNINFISFY